MEYNRYGQHYSSLCLHHHQYCPIGPANRLEWNQLLHHTTQSDNCHRCIHQITQLDESFWRIWTAYTTCSTMYLRHEKFRFFLTHFHCPICLHLQDSRGWIRKWWLPWLWHGYNNLDLNLQELDRRYFCANVSRIWAIEQGFWDESQHNAGADLDDLVLQLIHHPHYPFELLDLHRLSELRERHEPEEHL